jgi:transcriptional regulator with XRE-family HTH domain
MRPIDPDRVILAVGRRLSELRAKTGLSQEEFAHRARFSTKYLQRVEEGLENLTLRSLTRFANLLGVRFGELFRAPSSQKVAPGRPRKRR